MGCALLLRIIQSIGKWSKIPIRDTFKRSLQRDCSFDHVLPGVHAAISYCYRISLSKMTKNIVGINDGLQFQFYLAVNINS